MINSISDENFSIIKGGLMERGLIFLRIVRPNDPRNTNRKIIFFVLITWLPLLIMTLISGLFWTDRVQIPFLYDFPVHIRFLIAIPMLLMAEVITDERVKLVINQFGKAGLLHEEGKPVFEKAKLKADSMVESLWAEAFMLIFIVANISFRWVTHEGNTVTSWQIPDVNIELAPSHAAWWFLTVSIPIFQFIILRWMWRWFIWFRLHLMISKAKLNLTPTHPDKAGGIGFLGEPPAPFSMVTIAFGIVISSIIASKMIFFNEPISKYYYLIGIFIFICILINIIPLLIYFKPLRMTRIKGTFAYSALIQKHHLEFTEKWFKSATNEELLIGNPDISSMCDFTPVYDSIENMHPFPFDFKIMLATILASVIPLLPLVLLMMPITELLKVLVGFLF